MLKQAMISSQGIAAVSCMEGCVCVGPRLCIRVDVLSHSAMGKKDWRKS